MKLIAYNSGEIDSFFYKTQPSKWMDTLKTHTTFCYCCCCCCWKMIPMFNSWLVDSAISHSIGAIMSNYSNCSFSVGVCLVLLVLRKLLRDGERVWTVQTESDGGVNLPPPHTTTRDFNPPEHTTPARDLTLRLAHHSSSASPRRFVVSISCAVCTWIPSPSSRKEEGTLLFLYIFFFARIEFPTFLISLFF